MYGSIASHGMPNFKGFFPNRAARWPFSASSTDSEERWTSAVQVPGRSHPTCDQFRFQLQGGAAAYRCNAACKMSFHHCSRWRFKFNLYFQTFVSWMMFVRQVGQLEAKVLRWSRREQMLYGENRSDIFADISKTIQVSTQIAHYVILVFSPGILAGGLSTYFLCLYMLTY